jgi:hypothetical protein
VPPVAAAGVVRGGGATVVYITAAAGAEVVSASAGGAPCEVGALGGGRYVAVCNGEEAGAVRVVYKTPQGGYGVAVLPLAAPQR